MPQKTAKTELQVADLNTTQMMAIAQGGMSLPSSEFELVSGNYLKFEPNQLVTLVCTGLVEGADYNDKDKMIPDSAGEFITAGGATVINQDAVMVATLKRLKEQGREFPCILQVYNKGNRVNAKGKEYADLAIGRKDITPEILAAISGL